MDRGIFVPVIRTARIMAAQLPTSCRFGGGAVSSIRRPVSRSNTERTDEASGGF